MPKFITVQKPEDLPVIPQHIENLYLDVETTSYHRAKHSTNPWRNCWSAGYAFTWDEHARAYYLPVGHDDSETPEVNFPEGHANAFIQTLFNRSRKWINHHIKYDAHVCINADFNISHLELWCTLNNAKLLESDRFGYGLDTLTKEWLGRRSKTDYKAAFSPWLGRHNKDWGLVPISLMGPYACNDTWENREIHLYIEERLPEECKPVRDTELKVTWALLRAERSGLRVNETTLQIDQYQTLRRMTEIVEEIEKDHGIVLRPSENPDCHEIFHHKYGLPVVRYCGDDPTDDTQEPSYDKYALAALKQYPGAPLELIEKCEEYRGLASHSGFVSALMREHIDGVIHSTYNQSVRTGRMSCKEPNNQQWDTKIKNLIIPDDDYFILDVDFSSIEFRLLAHYLNQPEILQKFIDNPDADFHQIVADMCKVERKPAKNINFCMAYGGGKKKVLSMLASDASIISGIKANTPDEFTELCEQRANQVFYQYHRMVHRLRPLTHTAAGKLKAKGYVRNGFGRHRRLPKKAAYRALNTVIQSTAADLLKRAVANTCPLYNDTLASYGVEQLAFVHDSIVFKIPKEHAPGIVDTFQPALDNDGNKIYLMEYFDKKSPVLEEITRGMLEPGEGFNVPMRISADFCPNNWGQGSRIPKGLLYGNSER